MADASGLSISIDDNDEVERIDPVTGTVETTQSDGGVVVNLDARRNKTRDGSDESRWFTNLADDMDGMELARIAGELVDAIEADDRSRDGYLQTRARGLDLLGIRLEQPSGAGDVTGSVEGMSKVTNPLLLEALLKGWANAQAELLPADGPMKVMAKDGMTGQEDDLAETLENDFNYYLTKTAPEYYPDTSHMLLWGTYFGGSGIKKVYRCPMRRRPVSESVDVKDFIVSDVTKDLRSCSRITHVITMRPSVLKRMEFIGAYRDVELSQPTQKTNVVNAKIDAIQGTQPSTRPEDQPYNLWETQCELDLDDFIPAGSQFKGEGIALPYLVTLDKDPRTILAIRRDWNEHDEECQRRRLYVKYPYVPGPGFYGTGMLNILGNSSEAMTAAWREALDAGCYANFPAGLISKLSARQNTNLIRMSPGEFAPIETNGQPIGNVVMGLPYKDVTPGLLALIDKITQQSQQVGGSADIPAGEGLQNVPVGTMLAQIEQATKIMAAAHKGMHQAQGEEFSLLVNLFRENPDDFWRGYDGATPKNYWDEQKFLQALNDYNLVPVADPNVPSHLHRVAKALGLLQLIGNPIFTRYFNVKEALLRIMNTLREDADGLVIDPPPQEAQPDPNVIRAQAAMMKAQSDMFIGQNQVQVKAQELALQQKTADTNLQREAIIHQADQAKLVAEEQRERVALAGQMRHEEFDRQHRLREHDLNMRQQQLAEAKAQHEAQMASGGAVAESLTEQQKATMDHVHSLRSHDLAVQQHELEKARASHEMQLSAHQHALEVERHRSEHEARMKELDHKADEIEIKRRMAARKPAASSGGKRPGFADGGAVAAQSSTWDEALTGLASAFREMAASNMALAAIQSAPRTIVRDENGRPVGVRMQEYEPAEPELKVRILNH